MGSALRVAAAFLSVWPLPVCMKRMGERFMRLTGAYVTLRVFSFLFRWSVSFFANAGRKVLGWGALEHYRTQV